MRSPRSAWHLVPVVTAGGEWKRMLKEVEASGRVVLACRSCGERVVLLGSVSDWYREGRETFGCGCGRELTLADRIGGARLDVAVLIREPDLSG